LDSTAQVADARVGSGGQLGGRPVKVVDGSTVQLADTPENQERYPQPSTQKRGCGFPVMKLAVLLSLTSGAVVQVLVYAGAIMVLFLFIVMMLRLDPFPKKLEERSHPSGLRPWSWADSR
jgi:hypothetical protein